MFAHTTLGAINWGAFARGLAVFSIGLSLMGALALPAATRPDRAVPPNPLQGRPAPAGDLQQSALPRPIPTYPVGTIFHAAGPATGGEFSAYLSGTTVVLKVWRFYPDSSALRQTVLFYAGYSDSTQTYDCAYGPIPNEDLSDGGAGSLHLNTDTGVNKDPDFYRCGPGGVIDVLFKSHEMMQGRAGGDAETDYSYIRYHSIQQGTEFSALARGSIYGMTIPDTAGELAHAHQLDLTIERAYCPPPCQ